MISYFTAPTRSILLCLNSFSLLFEPLWNKYITNLSSSFRIVTNMACKHVFPLGSKRAVRTSGIGALGGSHQSFGKWCVHRTKLEVVTLNWWDFFPIFPKKWCVYINMNQFNFPFIQISLQIFISKSVLDVKQVLKDLLLTYWCHRPPSEVSTGKKTGSYAICRVVIMLWIIHVSLSRFLKKGLKRIASVWSYRWRHIRHTTPCVS